MLVGNLQLLYHQCEPQLIGTPRAGRNVLFFVMILIFRIPQLGHICFDRSTI
jgi:hypothetical protein